MSDPPTLSETEWAIVIDLMEQEQREIPSLIHHATSLETREELRARLKMVETILERLHAPAGR